MVRIVARFDGSAHNDLAHSVVFFVHCAYLADTLHNHLLCKDVSL